MLVVVPDFPSPWSTILWTVELPNDQNYGSPELIFDDATGALLGGQFFVSGQTTEDAFGIQHTEQAASAYADGLSADYENLQNWYNDDWEHCWSFSVRDSEDRIVIIDLIWDISETGNLYLTLEPAGDSGSTNAGEAVTPEPEVFGKN